jgi:hypothetical protein
MHVDAKALYIAYFEIVDSHIDLVWALTIYLCFFKSREASASTSIDANDSLLKLFIIQHYYNSRIIEGGYIY